MNSEKPIGGMNIWEFPSLQWRYFVRNQYLGISTACILEELASYMLKTVVKKKRNYVNYVLP